MKKILIALLVVAILLLFGWAGSSQGQPTVSYGSAGTTLHGKYFITLTVGSESPINPGYSHLKSYDYIATNPVLSNGFVVFQTGGELCALSGNIRIVPYE